MPRFSVNAVLLATRYVEELRIGEWTKPKKRPSGSYAFEGD